MHIVTFNNTELHLIEHPSHEFLLSNKEVALGYSTTIALLSQAKKNHSDELIEGKHWLRLEVQTKGGKQKVIHWTKRGIVRLGFFIKSKQAKEFRDWAEDYIVQTNQIQQHTCVPENLNAMANGYRGQLAKKQKEIDALKARIAQLENDPRLCEAYNAALDTMHAIDDLRGDMAELYDMLLTLIGKMDRRSIFLGALRQRVSIPLKTGLKE